MSNVTLTWILFVNLLYSCGLIHSTSADLSVEGKLGDDVTLQCQATKDFTALKWNKPDPKSDYYVYFIRDEKEEKLYQHESFKDRVELEDPNMKNGDASVILKNITISDTGTYECYVGEGGSSELINRVTLTVQQVQNIRAQPGENVFLPCSAQKNSEILVVEWTRRFPTRSDVAFLYQDGRPDPVNQHPFFTDGVELKDKEMKDGDVSLILKNSETQDTGTYECRVIQRGTDQGNRTETTCIINLTVFRPDGDKDGNTKLSVSQFLEFCLLLLVLLVL